ncbi:MAG: carboxypeptidase regulatory-like domain-containing protein, partial [Candidatus Thiodiazotropha sp.]
MADFNKKCQSPSQHTQAGSIAGRITGQSGAGLGWVKVATTDRAYSTLATETGNYELPNVPPGQYVLVARLDGFIGASRNITVIEGKTLFADFTLLPLQAPATINGFVLDANQAPLAGVIITSDNGIYSTVSSADGSYTLGNIANGSLSLTTRKVGYAQVSHSIAVVAGQTRRLDFVLRGINEICTDGIDNDGNSLTDCGDPACMTNANCAIPAVEICADGIDNNGNGLNDCDDPACLGHLNCASPVAEICNDGTDNNGDGLLDCDDPLCNSASHCLPENCNDGIDNNGDQLIDCIDPICADTSTCRPPPVEICNDSLDNDGDSYIDCADTKCASQAICTPQVANELCNNGIDDNGDGYIDCNDTLCKKRAVCLHENCKNAIDDDADGHIDCEDRECRGSHACSDHQRRRSLNFSVRASEESLRYKAKYAGDRNQSTRWWGYEDGKQWLMLDLGGIYPIDRIDISWHDYYADQYNIRISKNGRYWETIKAITSGDGGFDRNSFEIRKARFVLIEVRHAIASSYSIYEVEIFRSDGEIS